MSNLFGGKNSHGLYVPLTALELEALTRLREQEDLRVNVVGWGFVERPTVRIGDASITLEFNVAFTAPEVAVPVSYLDFELVGAGRVLYRARESVVYGDGPLWIKAGVALTLQWSIQIKALDPKLVKEILPGATGLTSLRTDRDTGEITPEGNLDLNDRVRGSIQLLELGEENIRRHKAASIAPVG